MQFVVICSFMFFVAQSCFDMLVFKWDVVFWLASHLCSHVSMCNYMRCYFCWMVCYCSVLFWLGPPSTVPVLGFWIRAFAVYSTSYLFFVTLWNLVFLNVLVVWGNIYTINQFHTSCQLNLVPITLILFEYDLEFDQWIGHAYVHERNMNVWGPHTFAFAYERVYEIHTYVLVPFVCVSKKSICVWDIYISVGTWPCRFGKFTNFNGAHSFPCGHTHS